MKQLKVLSLFDGMSCGQLVISQLGFNYEYYASEIDKHAIAVTMSNFPDTIQLGSVEHWPLWSIDFADIDLIIGGSPCQGFSFAGKQLNFEDPRSKLFFVYVEILNYIRSVNPNVKFLLENVKMKKEYEAVISEQLGVQPIEINSNLVSAQNRKRLYWTNIAGVTQPEDRGIYLKDILQEEVDEKYYLSDKGLSGMLAHRERNAGKGNGFGVQFISGESEKANTVLQRYYKDCKDNTLIASGRDKTGVLLTDKRIRRLTPIECERLQTVPDNYTAVVSDTQRYRMLGNGWTVEVIKHILNNLKV